LKLTDAYNFLGCKEGHLNDYVKSDMTPSNLLLYLENYKVVLP